MNQSNINIDEVLKASLEHQETTVSFDDIWDKYSKNKGPVLVYKRLTVLVAAVLVLLISIKYISSMPELSNTLDSSKKMALKFTVASAPRSSASENKKQKSTEAKSDNRVALFNEPVHNLDSAKAKAKVNLKAKTFKSEKSYNTQKKAAPLIAAKLPMASAKKAAAANAASKMAKIASTATDTAIEMDAINQSVTNAAISVGKIAPKGGDEATNSFVIWDNRSYYKTETIVEQKDLEKNLGKTIEQTANPLSNGEGNELPVGTMIYTIKGEDSQKVIAVKLGDTYYRAVTKDVK